MEKKMGKKILLSLSVFFLLYACEAKQQSEQKKEIAEQTQENISLKCYCKMLK